MSDAPFQRPGSVPRKTPRSPEASSASPAAPVIHEPLNVSASASAPSHRAPRERGRGRGRVLAASVVGALAGGLFVAFLTVGPPPPAPLALTVNRFPREILGQTREDIAFRDAGAIAVIERLDAQFEFQLRAHRFAYGGDGATYSYGNRLDLTIVNGRLAPSVPVSGDGDDWETPTAVSLQSNSTSCVSQASPVDSDPAPSDFPVEPGTGTTPDVHTVEMDEVRKWTDCVLVDAERNVSLRLAGHVRGSNDAQTTATLYRDELERIHADLVSGG